MPEDRVTFSRKAMAKLGHSRPHEKTASTDEELSTEEKQVVNDLKKRDAEVKAHEAAHMASAGGLAQGGASYEYEKGPDGRMYAVGGEVKIDVSPASTPEATIQKMQQVRAAALAPAQPSGSDRAVAAQASQIEMQARMEKNQNEKDDEGKASASATQPNQTTPFQSPTEPSAPGSRISFMA